MHAAVAQDVERVNEQFARNEQIKKFALLERDLARAEDELTPTLEVKRAAVHHHFADRIDGLYGG